jgi:hypothetical protein
MTGPAATPPPTPVVQHKLIIEPDFEPIRWRRFRRWLRDSLGLRTWRSYPVQHRPFWLILTAQNSGDTAITTCQLYDVHVHGAAPGGVRQTFSGAFDTGLLNPGQHRDIEIGIVVTFLEGQTWVECSLRLPPNEQVLTHQYDRVTRGVSPLPAYLNRWLQTWFVHRRVDIQIARLSVLLVLLTLVTALVGVLQLRGCSPAH